jgi:hypothetical protein
MTFDRELLFSLIRKHFFNGSITDQRTVDTINEMISLWESKYSTLPLDFLGYAFATAYHETQYVLYPNRELGGNGYLKKMYDITGDRPDLAKRNGNINPGDGVLYAGKGLAHITWRNNYRRLGRKLGIPLEEKPELALHVKYAVLILIDGMLDGEFTSVSLFNCYKNNEFDAVKARKIINGTDKAQTIANYSYKFTDILKQCIVKTNAQSIEQPVQTITNSPAEVTVSHGGNAPTTYDIAPRDIMQIMKNNVDPTQIDVNEYNEFLAYKQTMWNSKPFTQSSTLKTVVATLVGIVGTFFGVSKYVDPNVLVEIITGIATVGVTIIGAIRATEKNPKVLRLRG